MVTIRSDDGAFERQSILASNPQAMEQPTGKFFCFKITTCNKFLYLAFNNTEFSVEMFKRHTRGPLFLCLGVLKKLIMVCTCTAPIDLQRPSDTYM